MSNPKATASSQSFSPMVWRDNGLQMLDQTRLPREEVWLDCRTPEDVAAGIKRLSVRGAPAIGVAAAYGLVLGALRGDGPLDSRFRAAAELLGSTRPTAVNLMWAIDQGRDLFEQTRAQGDEATISALLDWAHRLHREDVETNRRIGQHGAALFAADDRVLTHCNAGALATGGFGTAIGVIQAAWERGSVSSVWVDETRPLLQGARLTTWELKRLGIPHRLVTDSSAGSLLSRDMVERIVVGADRIAANGDAANKIGTYPLAVLAHRHGVPFYVAAPLSTVDFETASGDLIPIEERAADEVQQVFGTGITPEETDAYNPAFDVTPAELITAIITEEGVLKPPFTESLARARVTAAAKESGSAGSVT